MAAFTVIFVIRVMAKQKNNKPPKPLKRYLGIRRTEAQTAAQPESDTKLRRKKIE
jgi:hypothetical protein